jgi:hypothetical protein
MNCLGLVRPAGIPAGNHFQLLVEPWENHEQAPGQGRSQSRRPDDESAARSPGNPRLPDTIHARDPAGTGGASREPEGNVTAPTLDLRAAIERRYFC